MGEAVSPAIAQKHVIQVKQLLGGYKIESCIKPIVSLINENMKAGQ